MVQATILLILRLLRPWGLKVDKTKELGVRLGDGHLVKTKGKSALLMKLGNMDVIMDACVLNLGGVDVILGVA